MVEGIVPACDPLRMVSLPPSLQIHGNHDMNTKYHHHRIIHSDSDSEFSLHQPPPNTTQCDPLPPLSSLDASPQGRMMRQVWSSNALDISLELGPLWWRAQDYWGGDVAMR